MDLSMIGHQAAESFLDTITAMQQAQVQQGEEAQQIPLIAIANMHGAAINKWATRFANAEGLAVTYLQYLKDLRDGNITLDELAITDQGIEPVDPRPTKKAAKNGHIKDEAWPEATPKKRKSKTAK